MVTVGGWTEHTKINCEMLAGSHHTPDCEMRQRAGWMARKNRPIVYLPRLSSNVTESSDSRKHRSTETWRMVNGLNSFYWHRISIGVIFRMEKSTTTFSHASGREYGYHLINSQQVYNCHTFFGSKLMDISSIYFNDNITSFDLHTRRRWRRQQSVKRISIDAK